MDQSRSEGQRRQVTVLFADMADYTPTSERIGEEAVFALMQDVIESMSETVHARGGAVQNVTGDGLMALFGAPVAIEDAPLEACRAAIDIQERLRAQEDSAESRYGVRPKFRVGLHTGPLVLGWVGDEKHGEVTALGDTVNLAARLQAEAKPGEIVISEATHRLVAGYVNCEFVGERKIKGKSEPQRVHALTGLKREVSRFDISVSQGLSAFVGRQSELETLDRCWKEVRAGALRIIDIVGEAGIGKSRLVHEFRQRLDPDKAIFLLGRCAAEGVNSPFLPFIEIVRDSFRLDPRAGRAEVERRLSRGLQTLGLNVHESLPYLLNLLGHEPDGGVVNTLDSEVVGVRTRNVLLDLLRERRRVSPVVLFIDDLHWIDKASAQLLSRIAESDTDLPLLLICSQRQPKAPGAPPGHAVVLRLDELSHSGTTALLRSRLGVEDIPEPLVRLVTEKSEGNPLFAEEIISNLLEKGAIQVSDKKASYEVAEGAAVPVQVENLLMDRVDRLDQLQRTVLEAASVIGPVFAQDIVSAASGLNGEVPGHLENLARQNLLVRDGLSGVWRFRHVLVQEAVYNSLLRQRREALHARIAEAIESSSPPTDHGDAVEMLAYHYAQTRNDAKAVQYLTLAGERSLTVYALEDAISRFREAIRRIDDNHNCADDATLVDILLKLARALYFTISFYEIIAMVERYLPVVERLGDEKRLARFLFETGYAHVFSGRHDIGRPMLERALAIGERIGDDEIIGYVSMGLIYHFTTWEAPTPENIAKIHRLVKTALKIATNLRDHWLVSKILTAEALYHNIMGRPDLGRQSAMRLVEYGRTTNDPRPRAMALWALAFADAIYFNYEDAIVSADESIAIGLNPIDHCCARCAKAIALANLDRAPEALECYGDARSRLWEGGLVIPVYASDPAKGVAMLKNGDFAEGVSWIEELQKRALELGNVVAAANTHLYLGEIFLEMATGEDKPPLSVMRRNMWFLLCNLPIALRKARHHLETAAKFYRDYDMPALLAWALIDLGRVHAAKKRSKDARDCLEEALPLAQLVNEPVLIERVNEGLAKLPV
jgi:class 3 adenylate cyclase/tetratricopeptide (TPR) repeat protein